MKASLVIPCFNESESISELVARVQNSLPNELVEVIFVDNGSNDDTRARLRVAIGPHPQMKVLELDLNLGYGAGIKAGVSAAIGEVVAWTHADLQSDPALAWQAISRVESVKGPLMVKGRRTQRGAVDVFFTWGMSVLIMLLFGRWLADINGQPTAIPASMKSDVMHGPADFSLDLHVFISARRQGIRVVRFAAPFGSRKHGVSSWNTGIASRLKMVRRVVAYAIELRREGAK